MLSVFITGSLATGKYVVSCYISFVHIVPLAQQGLKETKDTDTEYKIKPDRDRDMYM